MADRKISDLTALTTPASGDYLPIVDISEAAASDKNKRITIEELMRGVPDGTVGAPGIAFESDPNTGIYSPGADQVAVATNGQGRLFVDANGKVGLGTATPGSYNILADNLVIVGTQNEGISIISGTNNAGNIWFGDADAQGQGRIVYSHLADRLTFSTGGTERLYIASTGAIGVGGGVGGANYGTAGQILTSSGSAAAPTWTSPPTTRNHIINGDFSVAQRGTSFGSSSNYDDFYTLDRWYILCDGINDVIDVTQETSTVPTNQKYAIALDVETVNKKFGIAQIIENVNCVGLTGGNVTLSFKAKVSSTTKLDNVKAAIVAWSGTADTVTSDIISAWGAEGTNPTLIANATYENTPANLNVTTSYASYSLSANIDTASTSNIIVFIWSDVTDTTAGDFLYITDVQLEPGTLATPFERRSYGQELALCERYFQIGRATLNGFGSTGGVVGSPQNYRTTMRTVAEVGLASFENINFSSITESNSQPGGFRLHGAIAPGTNINAYYAADYFANAEL